MKQFLLTSVNRYRSALFCAVLFFIPAASFAESKIFPVPDIIKPNVAFWIRIYTEVSLQEGLLHDREYPQIVYEKVIHGGRRGKALSDHIDSRRKIYQAAIRSVREGNESKWGPVEKQVAEAFKNAPQGALADAENRIRHQTGQRERFKQGVERSAMYLDTISAILKQNGVPDELKYLPHVESSFDAEAYSKAGAAGLWQFMRPTGRGFMRIDYMFDERRDAIISSHAAAKFLRQNYNMLQTWPLAITAYNHGPNGIRRAVAAVGSRDIADILEKHESPTFKFASKNFYSCFLAVLEIMENLDHYVKDINYRPRFEATSIKLPFAMRPDALIRSLGITQQEFARLNPSLRPVMYTQQKPIPAGYAINIPANMDGRETIASLNRTPAPQRPTVREVTEPTGGYYTVVSGDNLHNIARRHGVSMQELASVNNITNSSRIFVGQVLVIPSSVAAAAAAAVSKDTAAEAQPDRAVIMTAAQQDSIAAAAKQDSINIAARRDSIAVAAKRDSIMNAVRRDSIKAAAKQDSIMNAVRRDSIKTAAKKDSIKISARRDSIAITAKKDSMKIAAKRDSIAAAAKRDSIKIAARRDSVKAAAKQDSIMNAARIDSIKTAAAIPDTISAAVAFSEAVSVPALRSNRNEKPVAVTHFDAAVYNLGMTVAPGAMSVKVKVSVDETLTNFAEWMRVYTADIRRLNNLAPDAPLKLGQTLSIPIGRSSDIKKFEVSRLEHHMAIEEDFFARYNIVDFERRRVRSGESLWRICNEAKIPLWLLKKFNRNVNVFALKPGDNLWIPRIAAKDNHEVPSQPFEVEIGENIEE
ncbi:MAG: LysM peptidoglycan-binding domain-containing protein [Chitinispirillia bacterium]|nr:LysM peptidoglycan-binding domain-containing protein [Chitinispirillia bacterium]